MKFNFSTEQIWDLVEKHKDETAKYNDVTLFENYGKNTSKTLKAIGLTVLEETVPSIPIRNGYVFVGYYDSSVIGTGNCYLDSGMNLVKQVIGDLVLFAHWARVSASSIEVHAAGNDNTYSSKENNESNWEGLWGGSSTSFSTNFNSLEVKEAIAAGYKYVKVKIRLDIYEEIDCWEWISFKILKDEKMYKDWVIYKVSAPEKKWINYYLYFTVDAEYFADISYSLQFSYGVSGGGKNKWKRGYTSISFELVKDTFYPYIENAIEGGLNKYAG